MSRALKLSTIFLLMIILAVILIRINYQYINTVSGTSTGIRYEFSLTARQLNQVQKIVSSVAEQYGLKIVKIPKSSSAAENENNRKVFHFKGPSSFKITLDAYHADGDSSQSYTAYLTIYDTALEATDIWMQAGKELQTELSSLVEFRGAHVGLNHEIYGSCATSDRPNSRDAICSFNFDVPVNFETMSKEIEMLKLQREAMK